MNREIFRAYDIRGVVERDLPPSLVEGLGRALGSEILERGGKTLAVGRDCRLTSPRLRDDLIRGLNSTGINVLDVGEVPTPLLYFAVYHGKLDGGVMITGSHNPSEYNGFKMLMGDEALHGDAIQGLADRIEGGSFVAGEGTCEDLDITSVYLDWVCENISMGERRLKVVVDGGNGMGGPTAVALYERLGVEVVPLFIEPDGRFPNHHPDPTVAENLVDLIAAVRDSGADLGIGYDGDGDRIGVIDARGGIVWGDRLMILFSRAVLAEEPGATIIAEVKCSQTLYDDIAQRGGRGIMWKTGHSFIKAKIKAEGAALAGEMSGHIFFKHRYFGYDDAVYSGARLLELLSHSEAAVHELLEDVRETFATPELRVDCEDRSKFTVARGLAERFAQTHEVITVDGVRVTFPDGAWALVRASNTQPVLVLRVEAGTPERRDALEAWLRGEVSAAVDAAVTS